MQTTIEKFRSFVEETRLREPIPETRLEHVLPMMKTFLRDMETLWLNLVTDTRLHLLRLSSKSMKLLVLVLATMVERPIAARESYGKLFVAKGQNFRRQHFVAAAFRVATDRPNKKLSPHARSRHRRQL
jgi:hypothetical protein